MARLAARWERMMQSEEWEELSPVHHGVSVEGHEENLAATSRTHRCKEYLEKENIARLQCSFS